MVSAAREVVGFALSTNCRFSTVHRGFVLAEIDRRKSQVLELPFFGGLSVAETAETLDGGCQDIASPELVSAALYSSLHVESADAPENRIKPISTLAVSMLSLREGGGRCLG